MLYKGIFKRVVPFFLTFAAGLFVASFFVAIAVPNFNNWRSSRVSHKYRELQRLRIENRELRDTNCRQRKELEELRRKAASIELRSLENAVPPVVEFDSPPPPSAPRYRGHAYGSGTGR